MPEILDTEVVAGLTVLHLAVAFVAIVTIALLVQRLTKKKTYSNTEQFLGVATCSRCGWSGRVSQYARQCKECGGPV